MIVRFIHVVAQISTSFILLLSTFFIVVSFRLSGPVFEAADLIPVLLAMTFRDKDVGKAEENSSRSHSSVQFRHLVVSDSV